jgi:hypothetical protein
MEISIDVFQKTKNTIIICPPVNGTVQPVIRRLQILVPQGRIYSRTCGYKWNLLEVREGK